MGSDFVGAICTADDIAVYIGTLSVCLEYNVGNF